MHILLPLATSIPGATFPLIVIFIVWALFAVINFWVWSKGKALGNLLMLIGGAVVSLGSFIVLVSDIPSNFTMFWMPLIGAGLILGGFFSCSKPLIQAQLAAIKAKMDSMKDASDDDAGKDAPAEEPAKDSPSES